MNWSYILEGEEPICWKEVLPKYFFLVALFILIFGWDSLHSQERPRVIDVLRESLNNIETQEIWVPYGTPDDATCRAFWKMRSYQELQKRYKEAKLKDPPFEKVLASAVSSAAEQADGLF